MTPHMTLGKAMLLAVTPLLLAATQPQTLAPRVTGSMYKGNNVHAPKLQSSQQPTGMSPVVSKQSQNQTTGTQSQGKRSAEGGGG